MKIQKILLIALAVCAGAVKAGPLDGKDSSFLNSADLHATIATIKEQTVGTPAVPISNIKGAATLSQDTVSKLAFCPAPFELTTKVALTMAEAFEAVQKAWTPADLTLVTTGVNTADTAATNIKDFSAAAGITGADIEAAVTALQDGIAIAADNDPALTDLNLQSALTYVKQMIDKKKDGAEVVISEGIGALQAAVGYEGVDLKTTIDTANAAIDATPATVMSTGISSVLTALVGTVTEKTKIVELNELAVSKNLAGLSEIELLDSSISGQAKALLTLIKQVANAEEKTALGVWNASGVKPVDLSLLETFNWFTVMNKCIETL
jgi:uncharacterized protein with ATP-grasp and redox domains